MSFFSKKNKIKHVLLIDIETRSISMSLVRLLEDEKYSTITSIKNSFPYAKEFSYSFAKKQIKNLLNKMLKNVSTLGIRPDYTKCFISSSWAMTHINKVSKNSDNLFVFSKKIKEELINQANKDYFDFLSKNNASFGDIVNIMDTIETSVFLNGYRIKESVNNISVKSVNLSFLMSALEKDLFLYFKNHIESYFGDMIVYFNPSVYSLYSISQKYKKETKDYIAISLEDETTDIVFVKNDDIVEILSFPVGIESVTRIFAEKENLSILEAQNIISMIHKKIKTPKEQSKYFASLSLSLNQWFKNFSSILSMESHQFSIPNDIFMFGDSPVDFLLSESLRKEDFAKFISSGKNFCVFLNPKEKSFISILK